RVGVDTHELHAVDTGRDHVGHGVAAATTYADHLDDGALAVCVHQFKHGYRSLHKYKRLVGSRFIALSASKVALEPGAHALEHRFGVPAQGVPAMCGPNVVTRVEQQPHAGGINRVAHHLGKTPHGLRDPQAHRHVEHFLGEFDGAFHLGAAAGEHDAGGDHFLEAAAPQLLAHQAKELLVARPDDLGERLAREAAGGALTDARHLDALVGVGELPVRAGVADLDVLGVLGRGA